MTDKAAENIQEINGLEELEVANIEGTQYDSVVVESKNGKKFRLHFGSVSAGTIIDWQEKNDGPAKKNAGITLICAALVSSGPERTRYAAACDAKSMQTVKALPQVEYEKLVTAIMKLNGFDMTKKGDAKPDAAVKND